MKSLSQLRYVNLKKVAWYILFIVSFTNEFMLIGWLLIILLWVLLCRGEEKKIEVLIMIQLRSLINPGIAVPFSGMSSMIKWGIIFLVSLVIFLCKTHKYLKVLNKIYLFWGIYSIFLIASAWISSSYPIVATFKIISYVFPFLAIIKGICDTNDRDWMKEITQPLGILLISSVVLLPTPVGYLRNGYAFQGFFNHPNVYGVMLALFLAGYLYGRNEFSLWEIIMIIIITALAVLSGSRTGMFTCIIVVMLFLLSKEVRSKSKTIIYILLALYILIGILFLNNSAMAGINSLIFKGHEDSLFYSRETQITNNMVRFKASPIIGTGFNVPYVPGSVSMQFSFDLVVENGNLILALLGDSGILGTIFFVVCYIYIYVLGYKSKILIYVIPFVVSMGEQSFFSTNNFGIILYMFIAIYLADGLRIQREESIEEQSS